MPHSNPPTHVPIDAIDRKLLTLLHDDARTSVRALARAVEMSPGAVGERLDRLEKSGVIRGFRVDVDLSVMGLGLEALIGLQVNQGRPLEETVQALAAIPEVASVRIVTGQWDLVVLLRVRDHWHLRDVLIGSVWKIPDFRHSESMTVLETVESSRGPADLLEPLDDANDGS